MSHYRESASKPVEPTKTKYDDAKFEFKNGVEYKGQKGSARGEIFGMIKNGSKVGTWLKNCADKGYDTRFCVSSIERYMDGCEDPFFKITGPNGERYETLRAQRSPRGLETAGKERAAKAKAAPKEKAAKAAPKEKVKAAPKEKAATKAPRKRTEKEVSEGKAAAA